MDVAAISSAASHLIEAFEKTGAARGDGLTGSGPSPVPRDIARQFEDMLARGTGLPESDSSAAAYVNDAAVPQSASAAQGDIPASEPVSTADPAAPVETKSMLSIPEFFSLQFHVAMARFSVEAGSQIQQKTAQGFESLLKTQS